MRQVDIPETARQLVTFIKASVAGAGFSRVVIGVSGGVDSSTAAALATAALGPENVFVLLLFFKEWYPEARENARALLEQLRIPPAHVYEMDIAPAVEASLKAVMRYHPARDIPGGEEVNRIRMGNIMARVRMVLLFDTAKALGALVLGTENKTEHYLGYFTRFGDEASDIEPLRALYKTEVYQLAGHLGIPEGIRRAAPTAGLWPGQTDEGQFGFTYQDADEILYGLYEAGLPAEALMERGLDGRAVESVKAWVKQMEFKHKLPILAPSPVFLSTEGIQESHG
jgi:NAD+ synthase